VAPLYAIAEWDTHFEKNRTKELKQMTWVPIPNKQDGDGYTELLDHPAGAAHFGAWVALIQVASKCSPRGTLLRDDRNGVRRPHDPASLSRITRIPASVFLEALPRLIAIGWLSLEALEINDLKVSSSVTAVIPQDGAVIPHVSAASRARAIEQEKREENSTEQERRGGAGATPPEPRGASAASPRSRFTPPPLTGTLDTPELQAEWGAFAQHRRELRKPLTPQATKHAADELAEMGPERALRALRHTIAKGWQGIREPDPERTGNGYGRGSPPRPVLPMGATQETMEKFKQLDERLGGPW
jgi:hypothetical protein